MAVGHQPGGELAADHAGGTQDQDVHAVLLADHLRAPDGGAERVRGGTTAARGGGALIVGRAATGPTAGAAGRRLER
ncbi:hypothetical protein GCM10009714_30670 [Microlunatus capsulatus]